MKPSAGLFQVTALRGEQSAGWCWGWGPALLQTTLLQRHAGRRVRTRWERGCHSCKWGHNQPSCDTVWFLLAPEAAQLLFDACCKATSDVLGMCKHNSRRKVMESKINLSFSTSLSKTALDLYVVWLFSLISLPVGPHPANTCCQVYHLTELCCVIADQHYLRK